MHCRVPVAPCIGLQRWVDSRQHLQHVQVWFVVLMSIYSALCRGTYEWQSGMDEHAAKMSALFMTFASHHGAYGDFQQAHK